MAVGNVHTVLGIFGFLCLVCFDIPVVCRVTPILANINYPFCPMAILSPFFAGPLMDLGEGWLADVLLFDTTAFSIPFTFLLGMAAELGRESESGRSEPLTFGPQFIFPPYLFFICF